MGGCGVPPVEVLELKRSRANGSRVLPVQDHYRSSADRSVSPLLADPAVLVSPVSTSSSPPRTLHGNRFGQAALQRVAEHSPGSRSVSPLDCVSPCRPRGNQVSPDAAFECSPSACRASPSPHMSPDRKSKPRSRSSSPLQSRKSKPRSGSSTPSKSAARKKIGSIREPEPEYPGPFPALMLNADSHRWPAEKGFVASPSRAVPKLQLSPLPSPARYSTTSDDDGSSMAYSNLGFDDCQGPFRCLFSTGKAMARNGGHGCLDKN